MKIQKADLSVGILSIVFAIWFFVGSLKLPGPLNKANIGPGTFPLIISVFVIIIATMIIVTTLLKKSKDGDVTIVRFKNIIASIGMIVLYALTMPHLGFYLATAIYFPVMLYLASETNWRIIIFTTIIFELFAFVIFEKLLGVLLP